MNPNATLERSPETGVPLPDTASDTTVDVILENPGRGAGEPVSVPGREGAGLVPVLPLYEACGAGTVIKLLSRALVVGLLGSFFLLFVFSVLPLERGAASRNSAACGTALQGMSEIERKMYRTALPSVSNRENKMRLANLLLANLKRFVHAQRRVTTCHRFLLFLFRNLL